MCWGDLFTPASLALPEFLLQNDPMNDIDHNLLMSEKTMPGSYAIFSQNTIRRILSSSEAMQLFAYAKYGCKTCLEQYTWMTAMQLLDQEDKEYHISLHKQARINTAFFQLLDATSTANRQCQGVTTQNGEEEACSWPSTTAILSMDASRCYQIEHFRVVKAAHNESYNIPFTDWETPTHRLFVHGGDELVTLIRHAKNIGFLFAGPFDSTDPQSLALLDELDEKDGGQANHVHVH